MLPMMSNDLGKALVRKVISPAGSMLGSGMLVFKKVLSGAVFKGFGIVVFDGSTIMVL